MKEVNYGMVVDLTKHFGSIVGTPGISEEVEKLANAQLLRLTKALVPTVNKVLAEGEGLIV
jgi:hypothetical protein